MEKNILVLLIEIYRIEFGDILLYLVFIVFFKRGGKIRVYLEEND